MAAPEASAGAPERARTRHNHITIRLQLRVGERWEYVQARDWNAVGFSCSHPDQLEAPLQQFKRGLLHFAGEIAWRRANTDDEAVLVSVVNELIIKRSQSVSSDASLHTRLRNLVRVPGMVAQKRQILASLGLDIGDSKMAELVARRKVERPSFQFGVRVQSEVWTAVTDKALHMSQAVIALDNWSKALKKN